MQKREGPAFDVAFRRGERRRSDPRICHLQDAEPDKASAFKKIRHPAENALLQASFLEVHMRSIC